MKQVAIMAVAQNISKDTIDRFKSCIYLSKPSITFDIYLFGEKTPRGKNKPFNKSKLLNKGIKKLVPMNYDVIIQADIDLIVPPHIIDTTYDIVMNKRICFYNCHRRIDPKELPSLPSEYLNMDWDKYMKYPWEAANGCWNGMRSHLWMESGGYNEDMVEWGKEDDDWRQRASKYGKIPFLNWNRFCLIHYNHPTRTQDLRKRNRQCGIRSLNKGKWNWLT